MPAKKENSTRILNCIPSRQPERDWRIEQAISANNIKKPKAVPKSVDLRKDWWEIGDQQDTGSCVGWASVDSVFRWHFVKTHEIDEDELLSVRFIWMASKETDEFMDRPTTMLEAEGTSLKAALDIARNYGNVRDSLLPFDPIVLAQGDPDEFFIIAADLKIKKYLNLGTDQRNWKTWLATQGPILTRIDVDETWDNATRTNGDLDTYYPDTIRGGHAIALVGYTPDRFIVRNSWGKGWGDRGFAYASLAYAEEAFTEAYGVTV